MVRIALAQILYKPAIIERMIDHLSEPALVNSDKCLGVLQGQLSDDRENQLQTLLNKLREEYITYIEKKLCAICKEASRLYEPDILVFPEYSVPYQSLPVVARLSSQLNMTIIAGSHTVMPGAEDYYMRAGLDPKISKSSQGCSISPVFIPGAVPDYQIKHNRSIFEMTMREPEYTEFKRFRACTRKGDPYSFSVVLCADALFPDTLGDLNIVDQDKTDDVPIVFIVACSTSTKGFGNLAQLLSTHSIPTLVCNSEQYGGSGIYLSDPVRNRFTNPPGQGSYMEKSSEALMLVEIQPSQFFVKRGILDAMVLGYWTICPVIYGHHPKWEKDYSDVLQMIEESLADGRIDDAGEYAEIFVSLHNLQIPTALENAFNRLPQQLSNYCGDARPYLDSLKVIQADVHSTQEQFLMELDQAFTFCGLVGTPALGQVASIFAQREQYPQTSDLQREPVVPVSVARPIPTEKDDQIFRDRGNYMTQLQEAITNPRIRLILVSGAYGIGKTSTVAMTFKRNLPNWQLETIPLTPPVRFSMVLEYIANAVGSPLRADTLTRNSKKILGNIMDRFIKNVLSKDGRVIIIDQMESIFLEQQGRDYTLLTLFRDAIYNLSIGQGKLILISDIRFSKEIFPNHPSVQRIVMGRIPDNRHIKRILEYEMRRHNLISPGKIPDIPDELYDLVNGHPLTAKLCIEVVARHGKNAISDIPLGQLQSQVVDQLMKKICLDEVESKLLRLLSVFRTIIDVPRFKRYLPPDLLALFIDNLKKIDKMSFISIGEETLEVTAAFRNYYYDQILSDEKELFHECALNYYIDLHEELSAEHKFSAIVYTEIAYHLTFLNRIQDLGKYLPGNHNTMKLLAKTIYQRDKNYDMALQLYLMLNDAYPDDTETLSYLGRCYARKEDWDSVRSYFEKAISAAQKKMEDTWYLYRDWGHLNVRYYMDEEAESNFEQARTLLRQETSQDDDPGILAAEGFMMERNRDINGAIEKYEAALSLNYRHEFTIHNYAALLRKRDDEDYAKELEQRLVDDSFDRLGELTDDFYSGFDIIFDDEVYDE